MKTFSSIATDFLHENGYEVLECSSDQEAIDKAEDLRLRKRIQTLRALLPKRISIQLTLVTTYGLQSNQYTNQVNQTLTLDDLFVQ